MESVRIPVQRDDRCVHGSESTPGVVSDLDVFGRSQLEKSQLATQ